MQSGSNNFDFEQLEKWFHFFDCCCTTKLSRNSKANQLKHFLIRDIVECIFILAPLFSYSGDHSFVRGHAPSSNFQLNRGILFISYLHLAGPELLPNPLYQWAIEKNDAIVVVFLQQQDSPGHRGNGQSWIYNRGRCMRRDQDFLLIVLHN